jgi:hypothetical protein
MLTNSNMKPTSDELHLALKLECAVPAILFSRDLPLPLGIIIFLICLAVLLSQVSEDRVRRLEKLSAQFGQLLLWGCFSGIVCFIGTMAHILLGKAQLDAGDFLKIIKLVTAYVLVICTVRALGFVLFARRQIRR